jgi:hypothetical protein
MPRYNVYIHEDWVRRFDIEAETPTAAIAKAQQLADNLTPLVGNDEPQPPQAYFAYSDTLATVDCWEHDELDEEWFGTDQESNE